MHDAWLIPEVCCYIFGHLIEHAGGWSGSLIAPKCPQGALAVLARTCRAFSEPALDALWCELPTLRPLLQCARAGVSDELFLVEDESLLPLSDEEWEVVLRYAPRVRRLEIWQFDELSIKILQAVQFRTTLLLPNLRELLWSCRNHTDFDLIHLVLHPSLHLLDVSLGDGDETSILAFLRCYHTLCSNLRSLQISHAGEEWSLLVAEISRAICRSPDLEVLTCDYLNEEAFLHITRSSRLKKLSLRSLRYHPDDLKRLASYGTPDCPPFKNLRYLHLCLKDFSSIIPYLKACYQPFEAISLTFSEDSPPEVFHEFFTALDSPTRRQSLRQISLSNKNGLDEHMTSQIGFEVFSPLLGFNLHGFYLSLQKSISLNDDELGRLVQGWPDLETLHLNPYHGWGPTHFPTLPGLFNLLAQCPKLRTLFIYINAATISTEVGLTIMVVEVAEYKEWPIGRPIREGVSRLLCECLPLQDDVGPQRSALASDSGSDSDAPFRYRFRWREWDTSPESIAVASDVEDS